MVLAFELAAVFAVAVAMALALAHALELPGKLRLPKEQYLAVQTIYYPGFTVAGVTEPVGALMLIVLMFLFPSGSAAFWLTAAALAALAAMHLTFWVLTQPVNRFWVEDIDLARAGSRFFAFNPFRSRRSGDRRWTDLRDQWEFSHAVRAVLGIASLILLTAAIALDS